MTASVQCRKKLYSKKIQIMRVNKQKNVTAKFYACSDLPKRRSKLTYFACSIVDSWDYSYEINTRIETTGSAFTQHKKLLCNIKLNTQLRVQLLEVLCFLCSIA